MKADTIPVWYTVYGKNDNIIAIGNAEERARRMNITKGAFYSIVSRIRTGKKKTYCIAMEDVQTGSYASYGGDYTVEIGKRIVGKRVSKINFSLEENLYSTGMTDKEIAERFGLKSSQIWKWRKENGLPPNILRGGKRRVTAG